MTSVLQLILVVTCCEPGVSIKIGAILESAKVSLGTAKATLMSKVIRKTEAGLLPPPEWVLPSIMDITYGEVIEMKDDLSLWIGVHQPGQIATISKSPGNKYGRVFYATAANLNENRFLSRKLELFAESSDWDRNKAVALITRLAKKRLRVAWFCWPGQWMSYVLSGKPPRLQMDKQCPLRRDLTLTKPKPISAAVIGDKSFYLENAGPPESRKVWVDNLPRL